MKTTFCQHVCIFCATLNILVNMSLSFGCNIFFFVATTYFLVTYTILVRNVTSMWNIFSLTEKFFVQHVISFCETLI